MANRPVADDPLDNTLITCVVHIAVESPASLTCRDVRGSNLGE
jgi:hypothetical protein